MPDTAHDDDKPEQLTGDAAARQRAADAGRRNPAGRGIVAELQEALLPTALPVLPRVCQLTVELLTRTGHADDITALAAQWLPDPVPALHLSLPSERPSLTTARDAFVGWLSRLDVAADDREALHLAMVEVFTNAIEHAYPRDEPGTIELDATLETDGSVACLVTDHGTWRPPEPADADRGHGLMVAAHVMDKLLVRHPERNGAAAAGTTVTLRHRLRRPAILAPGQGEHGANPAGPPFTVDTSAAAGSAAHLVLDLVRLDHVTGEAGA